jgi:hypothetical protein
MSIIFLFSGNARTSPFNINIEKRSQEILKSYNENLFTEKFKSLYSYKIYITADDVHLEETINYFKPENIGNIHIMDTEYYLKPITNKIPNADIFVKQYTNKDFKNCKKFDNSINQHHKILDCYNLFRNDAIEKPLFVIRIRMDVAINKNILDILDLFNIHPELQIYCSWDFMSVGKIDIMNCYCTGLENNYGNYTYKTPLPPVLPIMNDYNKLNKYEWTYAAERQLFEMLFEYCNNNNLDINKSIMSEFYCEIIR